jgi:predicted nucleic acid-binding protein
VIAVDTSSLRRYLNGSAGRDVDAVAASLDENQLLFPPVVLTEILSEARLQRSTIEVISAVPLLEVLDGYWIRAGQLRARIIADGHKAKIADALIAQSCLDHHVALITHDNDFRHYEGHGLVLAE